ncbi:inositol polyphosphate kinase-like protein, putative [Leishmania panamensis]|uniref:Kinase n=1 Tax=Leishmania panamensis TaxID=5679 RepID=A0A088RLD0_LEIPA|nr:inositol polyphosphate kinase-like protein, putative [Leishmania panamensis]AIN96615.1 inositol polyphosphate kinase-like protein, putative [Leishmania panamensis]
MSERTRDITLEAVEPFNCIECKPNTSKTEESPKSPTPLLCDVNNVVTDALRLRNSSDELDGYCSSCEGSLPDISVSSSSEPTSRTALPTSVAAALHRNSSRQSHHRRRRYRGRGSPIRSAARDEERQRLVAISLAEPMETAETKGELVQSTDSATTTTSSPVKEASAVSEMEEIARESAFNEIPMAYPKSIAAATGRKTSLTMMSVTLGIGNRTPKTAKRSNSNSPHTIPRSAVGDMNDTMLLQIPTPILVQDEEGESTRLLHSSTVSQPPPSSRGNSNAVEASIESAVAERFSVETSPTEMPRPRAPSPTGTLSLAGSAVITSNGNNTGGDSGTLGMGNALRIKSGGTAVLPLVVEPSRVAPAAAGLMKSNMVNVDQGSVTHTTASHPVQGTFQDPSAEPQLDKKQFIASVDKTATGTTGVAVQGTHMPGVATLKSTKVAVLAHNVAAATSAKHLQSPLGSPTHVDLSSSSSVGGHHLSVTEGNAFLKQSGSRREEAFYNMIQPYQEALVREAVRQAPHTVEHWNHNNAGTQRAGVQEGAASTFSSSPSKARHHSPPHTSAGRRQSDDNGDGALADPDDVAAMYEARWEAYQQYEAEDMSNLCILASEQLSERNMGREHRRSGGDNKCAGPLHCGSSLPVSPHQVDKDLIELAARLWWTVRFRHFYRTSAPAYEVQRQAAEAAGLLQPSPSACSPAVITPISDEAAIANSRCSAPASQHPLLLPRPALPTDPSVMKQGKAEHREETAAVGVTAPPTLTPSVSGTATPCMVGSFAASLLEGVATRDSAVELQYAAQKHRALQLLASFVPRYHGTHRLFMRDVLRCERKGRATVASVALQREAGQWPQGGRQQIVVDADNDDDDDNSGSDKRVCMIMLEYVCYRFRHPCVMDIKMGSRQYGLHPSAEKKRSKERKAKLSTSARYGIRLAGYRLWKAEEGQYSFRGKLQCRSLSFNEVKSELSTFLFHSHEMKRVFCRQLQRLRVAFSQQTVFRFYTSSLLFVYDAEDPLATARVTMVDFAYTYESRELLQGGDPDAHYAYDFRYLKAIDTLLSLLA